MSNSSNSIYFVGIGGIGMSAIAKTAIEQGMVVEGSDRAPSQTTAFLQSLGAKIHFHQGTVSLPKEATLVVSTATRDLKEVRRAQRLGMRVLHRSEFLSELMEGTEQLLVAGTHGKTWTSALLVSVFMQAGLDPSFCIGGVHKELQTNGRKGGGRFFIAEADESDGSFLTYRSAGAIVTNIDADHLDHYKTLSGIQSAFSSFCERVKSHLFWCGDCPNLQAIRPQGTSYGFGAANALVISDFSAQNDHMTFSLTYEKKRYEGIKLQGVGRHLALSAAGVFGLALACGVEEGAIRHAFANFCGVRRRLEKRFSLPYLDLFDDYAHHPTAVRAVLEAVRLAYPNRRLVVAFQPHRYSRLKACLGDFAKGLELADTVLVTPVYSAGEPRAWDVSSDDLVDAINQIRPKTARGVRLAHLASSVIDELRPHDLFLSLGAGDITEVHGPLGLHFENYRPRPLRIGCIYGGRSSENRVSMWSWENIAAALDTSLYVPEHFYIEESGEWKRGDGKPFSFDQLLDLDVAFPIMHGPIGEDGALQGMLKVMGVATVGCGVLASSLAMDKEALRSLVKSYGIESVPTVPIYRWQWRTERLETVQRVEKSFGIPCFIKPVSLGSTDGVTRIDRLEDLEPALEALFELDEKLIVEPVMQGRELEFAALGSGAAVRVLPPGEVFSGGAVYGFDSKYSDLGPIASTPLAALQPEAIAEGQKLAQALFQIVGGSGLSRLDFFYVKGRYYFNEMNPIPGFTNWSLYPKMLQAAGIEMPAFVSEMIGSAVAAKAAYTRQVARYRK